jgi:hypothetical protein
VLPATTMRWAVGHHLAPRRQPPPPRAALPANTTRRPSAPPRAPPTTTTCRAAPAKEKGKEKRRKREEEGSSWDSGLSLREGMCVTHRRCGGLASKVRRKEPPPPNQTRAWAGAIAAPGSAFRERRTIEKEQVVVVQRVRRMRK